MSRDPLSTLRQCGDVGLRTPLLDRGNHSARPVVPQYKRGERRHEYFGVPDAVSISPDPHSSDVVQIVAIDVMPALGANEFSSVLAHLQPPIPSLLHNTSVTGPHRSKSKHPKTTHSPVGVGDSTPRANPDSAVIVSMGAA